MVNIGDSLETLAVSIDTSVGKFPIGLGRRFSTLFLTLIAVQSFQAAVLTAITPREAVVAIAAMAMNFALQWIYLTLFV